MRESDGLIFGPEISPGKPALRSVALSVVLHAAALTVLLAIPSRPASREKMVDRTVPSPTEIRIGDRIYFVADLSQAAQAAARPPAPKARAAEGRASKPPSPDAASEAKLTAPALPAPAPAAPKRAYVPPEIRRDQNATQILIQAQSPPDLLAPATALPSFRVTTEQTPLKFRKAFVVPGRPNPAPPAAPPELELPDPDLVHANPAPTQTEARLVLPIAPAPPPPVTVPTGPLPIQPGDPANILSLSDRPTPVSARLVVPPGNVVPAKAGDRTGTSATGSSQPGKPGDLASAANGSGTAPNSAPTSASNNASNGGSNNPSSNPSGGTSGNTSGNASTSKGGPPFPAPAGPTVTIGGSGKTASAAPVKAGGAASGPVVITRPATGNFDSVVVQSAPLDQYPESRGLLNHRPIYSVYVSVGTAMEWTLFFCVPEAKTAAARSQVVEIGAAPAPVKAPFPTRLVRPPVSLPSWQKYILVHGFVTAEGRFEGLTIVRPILPETDQAVLASLTGWEFRAATRDGVPIAVEFLLSIPAKGL